ncbi:MAG: hypothetical protein KA401_00295 [Anaerolineae bacterium]|nr:hypothetical protein [Chloroflexota bacterium]MBP6297755.1 hypothetical protein [Anaerolineae bacterium]
MIGRNPSNYHAEYMDVYQHWSPDTEKFGGGDSLITAIMMGWELKQTIYMEYKHFGGNRRVRVYHCRLTNDNQEIEMPVVHNPYVNRLIRQMQLVIEPYQAQKISRDMA